MCFATLACARQGYKLYHTLWSVFVFYYLDFTAPSVTHAVLSVVTMMHSNIRGCPQFSGCSVGFEYVSHTLCVSKRVIQLRRRKNNNKKKKRNQKNITTRTFVPLRKIRYSNCFHSSRFGEAKVQEQSDALTVNDSTESFSYDIIVCATCWKGVNYVLIRAVVLAFG